MFLFSSSILLFALLCLVNGHRHHGHGSDGHGHDEHGGPAERRQRDQHQQQNIVGEHSSASASGPCGCGAPSSLPSLTNGQPGVPLLLFPDHAQKAVDLILGAEGAFYWDNDELAHRVFDLLAHKFPQKQFLVGVGNSAASGRGLRPVQQSRHNFLHGTVKVGPGHSPFAFFDRRQFPRENETQLWYFVHVMEPLEQQQKAVGGDQRMAECLKREMGRNCLPADVASKCGLELLALIDQNTQPSLYASEALTSNPGLLKVLNAVSRCSNHDDQEDEGPFYAVAVSAGNAQEKEEEREQD